jgi:hypothetical protein
VHERTRFGLLCFGADPVYVLPALQLPGMIRQLSLDQFENEGRRVRDYGAFPKKKTDSVSILK